MSAAGLIGLAAAGVAFALSWVAMAGTQALRRRARIRKRMDPHASLLYAEAAESEPVATVGQQERPRGMALVGWLDARYPLAGGVRTAIIAVGSGALLFLVLVFAFTFFGASVTFATIVGACVGGGFMWYLGEILESGKRTLFSDRFLVVMEDFHRMVRYGVSTQQAMHSIAGVADEPVSTSLRNITLDAELGVPLDAAIDREARRVCVSDLSMFAAILGTQSKTGGNLSESVENLAKMLRERLDNRSRMKSSTAESRMTMVILSLVPLAAIGLQSASQPELVDVLLNEGRHLLGIGLALIVTGLAISWMIIRGAQNS